jgi:hypothetical protein
MAKLQIVESELDMADVAITAANVDWLGGTSPERVKAGGTITRGMMVYRDSADGEYKAADANGSATLSVVEGMAMTDGFDGKPMLIAKDGVWPDKHGCWHGERGGWRNLPAFGSGFGRLQASCFRWFRNRHCHAQFRQQRCGYGLVG